jgi:hypothetical protein
VGHGDTDTDEVKVFRTVRKRNQMGYYYNTSEEHGDDLVQVNVVSAQRRVEVSITILHRAHAIPLSFSISSMPLLLATHLNTHSHTSISLSHFIIRAF